MMKEWNEIYRDLLAGQNAIAEAIASAKTLHERDSRFMDEIKENYNEYRRRADSYEHALVEQQARIAELEAQLAAQAWRPVTEPPTDEGEYWGWDEHDGVFITHYNPDRDYDDDWAWSDYSGEMIPVSKWSNLVAPSPPTGDNHSPDNVG